MLQSQQGRQNKEHRHSREKQEQNHKSRIWNVNKPLYDPANNRSLFLAPCSACATRQGEQIPKQQEKDKGGGHKARAARGVGAKGLVLPEGLSSGTAALGAETGPAQSATGSEGPNTAQPHESSQPCFPQTLKHTRAPPCKAGTVHEAQEPSRPARPQAPKMLPNTQRVTLSVQALSPSHHSLQQCPCWCHPARSKL